MRWYFFLLTAILFQLGTADLFLERHRRTGGGNFDLINSIVNKLTLPLDLSIQPKNIKYKVGFVNVPLKASIGQTGECVDLKVNPGGDILVTGEFLDGEFSLDGFDTPMKAYEIEVKVETLQFQCTIPLKVEVKGFFSFVDTVDGFGDLTFRSEKGILSQKIIAYSPDFKTTPPVFSSAGECFADPVSLSYKGDSLGSVAGVSITGLIIDEISSDPNYVFNDVKTELCKLGDDLAIALGDFMVNNILTNTSSSFFIQAPFQPDPNNNNSVPALKLEEDLRANSPELDLLNFQDTDDFIVGLIVPEDPTEKSIVNTILKLITDPDDLSTLDPLLLLFNQEFDFPLQDDGTVVDWDFLSVIDGTFFEGQNRSDETLDFNFSFVLLEALFLDASITIDHLLIDILPLQAEEPGAQQPPILPAFQTLGQNTLLLDGVNLNEVFVDIAVTVTLNADNVGLPGNLFLDKPFKFNLQETVQATVDWKGFAMTVGILTDLDLDLFKSTEIQSFLDSLLDCVMSIFPLTPRVSGGLLSHDKLVIDLSQLFDALLVVVADIIEVIIPVYQPTIPKAIELIVDATLTNKELFPPATCPLADPVTDDLVQFPYNFSEGLIASISDFLDADAVNKIEGDVSLSGGEGIFVVGSEDGSSGAIGLTIPIPDGNGQVQDMSIDIRGISFEGILLPYFNELVVLKVIEDSEFFPQELRTLADMGKSDRPITMRLLLAIKLNPPQDPAAAQRNLQEITPEEDVIDIRFTFDRVSLLLDLYLHFSQYDVDSVSFGEVLNLGCWTERLNFPGGITDLLFQLNNISVTAECDCQNEMALKMAETFRDPSTWASQLTFLEDLLFRFKLLVTDIFKVESYENTLKIAREICASGDFKIALPQDLSEAYHTPVGDLVPYIAFFGFAVLVPSIVAALLKHSGPKLKNANKHKFNHHLNQMVLLQQQEKQEESDDKMLQHLHLTSPMWKNPLVPKWAKIGVPVVLVVNTILFVIGDTGNAVAINLVGQVLGVDYKDDGFSTLSVITSVIELWKSGGYLLASLMFLMSIFWPYLKLLLITTCWVLPVKFLPVERRGKIIEVLDVLGRFSFAEFHFLVFVLVVFQLRTGTPDFDFLPQEDLFSINLDIVPLLSLFTFALAVVTSIILSNVLLVLQHNIEDESRIKLREKHLSEMNGRNRANSLIQEAEHEDQKELKMTQWKFSAMGGDNGSSYSYTLTSFSLCLATSTVVLAFGALMAAAVVDSLSIELRGFFSYLVLFASGERDYSLSVVTLFLRGLEYYQGNAVIYVVAFVFISTIAIIPLLQTILLFYLLYKPMSVQKARKMAETHHIMTVWCCVDVFVLAVTLTVLELPTVAEGLQGTLAFCGDLSSFMEGILVPMQLVDHEDAISSCLSLRSSISIGAYLAVFSVLVLSVANIIVSKLFFAYIVDRENMVELEEKQVEGDKRVVSLGMAERSAEISSWHKKLRALGLIKICSDSSRQRSGTASEPSLPRSEAAPKKSSLRMSFHTANNAKSILEPVEDDPFPVPQKSVSTFRTPVPSL